ncbi:MAG: hypothetical protein HKN26_11735 [Acidimicrobiales bacterium]|nr:hypothetical protein [Acidimicrobiales bacterium]
MSGSSSPIPPSTEGSDDTGAFGHTANVARVSPATRAGARAVLDVRASIDGELVATIEHESIIELAGPNG